MRKYRSRNVYLIIIADQLIQRSSIGQAPSFQPADRHRIESMCARESVTCIWKHLDPYTTHAPRFSPVS